MKNSDINIENKPELFIVCLNDKCSFAEKCLRYNVGLISLETANTFRTVNPAKYNETNCKYYIENRKAKIAYGMKGSFEDVRAKDIVEMRKHLISYFGNNYYYKKRRGELPITPKEQDFVAKVFKSYGYEIVFDSIKEETLWE